jgi:hypothetical protein
MPTPISSSVMVCETVLIEKSDVLSAIRIMDTLTLPAGVAFARFYAVTRINSQPGDFQSHVAQVQMAYLEGTESVSVATAPDHRFFYGYKRDRIGPGGFNLTTEFNIDLKPLTWAGVTYWIQVFLDGQYLNQSPLTLLPG